MVDIDYDTVRIHECGNDLMKLSKDYILLLNMLHTRLNNMLTSTAEWVGPAAERYVNSINIEIGEYIELGNVISAYGSCLINTADDIERTINENKL